MENPTLAPQGLTMRHPKHGLERISVALRTRSLLGNFSGGPKGRGNPARGGTPGTGPTAPPSCTLEGCRRALLRPFRPPELRVGRTAPGFHPGLGSWRPFKPPEIVSPRVRNPSVKRSRRSPVDAEVRRWPKAACKDGWSGCPCGLSWHSRPVVPVACSRRPRGSRTVSEITRPSSGLSRSPSSLPGGIG